MKERSACKEDMNLLYKNTKRVIGNTRKRSTLADDKQKMMSRNLIELLDHPSREDYIGIEY